MESNSCFLSMLPPNIPTKFLLILKYPSGLFNIKETLVSFGLFIITNKPSIFCLSSFKNDNLLF